jgi:hypothetical protein
LLVFPPLPPPTRTDYFAEQRNDVLPLLREALLNVILPRDRLGLGCTLASFIHEIALGSLT